MRIPDGFPLEAAGPVLCAGVTMFSPLVHWKVLPSFMMSVLSMNMFRLIREVSVLV